MNSKRFDKSILLLGKGGMARETFRYILDLGITKTVAFYDDTTTETQTTACGKTCRVFNNVADLDNDYEFIASIGNPDIKKLLVNKMLERGLKPANTIIAPKTYIGDAIIGVGGVIAAGTIVTTAITLGDYVILNFNSTVGHDSIIEDFVTINPGANISGNVHIMNTSLIGSNAFVKEKITICKNTTVGALGCVVKDINQPGIYIGTPARPRLI